MGPASIAPNEREQQALASVTQRLLRSRPRTIGRYRIDVELGAGAMGTVFAGFDPKLGRKVAIKLLRRDRMRSPAARARFLQEARALAAVSHPNVVTVYEIGEHERDLFIAMELVEARTLEEWLRDEHPSWPAIIDAFVQLGSGLRAVHDGGVTHRDLKPSNILVAQDGRVRVVDFGLALLAIDPSISMSGPLPSDSQISSRLTDPGALLGTPAYMAPEQHVGAAASPASDQFSFCVTLWEALFGVRPFDVDTVEEFLAAVRLGHRTTLSRPRGLPRTVEPVLARGLHLDPDKRWPSIAVLLLRLERATSRRRSPLWMVGAAIVASAGGFVALAGTSDDDACVRLRERAEETWNDASREQVSASFDAAGRVEALPRVREMLDAYAVRWTERFDEVCGDAGPHEAAVACLDAKLSAMAAAVELLTTGVPTAVDRAPEVVSRLPDLGSCAPSTAGPPPEEAIDIWPVLARADALRHAGDLEGSANAAATAAARALELGYLPLVAEARLAEGRARGQQFDLEGAADHLEAAYLLAVDAGDDRLALDAALELFEHMMQDDGDYTAALQWWRHAEAAARRLGRDTMPPDRLVDYGILLHATGRGEEAQRVFEDTRAQALRALAQTEPTGMGSERLDLLAALGRVETRLRDYEAALGDMQAAVGVAASVFGPDSYTHALTSYELGSVAVTRGDYDIAIEHMHHAYEVLDRVAPGQRRANLAQAKLGWCLAQVGRYDEAVPMLEAAHAAQLKVLRPEHPDVLYAALTLAEVRMGAGRIEGVEELLERSLVAARALRGQRSSIAGAMLVRLGMLAERRAESGAAELRYREALDILRPDPTLPPSYVEALALLAQLVVQHGGFPEALALTDEMVRVGTSRYGPDATATLRIELIAARVYNEAGRGSDFVDRIARAHRLLAGRNVDPVFVARAQYQYARALYATDRKRALALAREAHHALASHIGGSDDASYIERWLAEQGHPPRELGRPTAPSRGSPGP